MSATLATLNRSRLFSAYNCAKGMVADTGRLNRALGVAMRKEARPYDTTPDGCTCPDWSMRLRYTGQPCKHMLSLALKAVASEGLLTGGSPSPATRSIGGSAPLNRSTLHLVPAPSDEDENPLKGLWS